MREKQFKFIISNEAKNLLSKAATDLHLVEKNFSDEKIHDQCGQHLAQATEKCLKFLISVGGGRFEKNGRYGHMLKLLLKSANDLGHFKEILDSNEVISLLDLEVYDSNSRYDHVFEEERLNIPKYLIRTSSLYQECLKIYKKAHSSAI